MKVLQNKMAKIGGGGESVTEKAKHIQLTVFGTTQWQNTQSLYLRTNLQERFLSGEILQ